MDTTTKAKVEENNFEDSWSGDELTSSSASGSPQTWLHQSEEDLTEIETATGRLAKIKSDKSRERQPLLNHEKTTIHQQSPTAQDPIEYRCELCISDGKKLKLYANKTTLDTHIRNVHSSTRRFKCEICFRPFNSASNLKIHSRVHLNKTLSFKCELCLNAFTTKAYLNLHLVQDHNHSSEEMNLSQCQLCISVGKKLKFYANKKALSVHISNVHLSTPRFKCEVCFKQFKFSTEFKNHTRGHLNLTINCEVCSLSFTKKSCLNKHLVRKHNYDSEKLNVKKLPCDLCTNIYFTKSELERHVVRAHVVDKFLKCHVCPKTVIDQEALSKHLKTHDKQPSHNCDVCSKAFKQKKNLLRHLGVEHHQFFRCDKCKTSFSNKSKFDAHSDLQLEIQNACQICNKTFRNQCSLRVHIQSHNLTDGQNKDADVLIEAKKLDNVQEKLKCEQCLMTFDRETYLVAHRNLVHPNTQWPCLKCSKTFKMRSQMKRHELTHAGVKPHTCKSCDKSYRSAKELKVHENNKHSNTKHFTCQMCPKSFGSRMSLKSHMGNFHGVDKPFKCHICGSSWVAQCYLKIHLVSHLTEKSFPCESCSKSFKCLASVKRHVREVHVKRSAKKQAKARKESESLVFVCNLCSFETQEDQKVAAHYSSHGLPKITLFREPFTSVPDFSESTHLGGSTKLARSFEKRYKCSTCSKLFNSPERLRAHSYSHSKRNLQACSICYTSFSSNFNLTRHLLNVHSQRKKIFKQKGRRRTNNERDGLN